MATLSDAERLTRYHDALVRTHQALSHVSIGAQADEDGLAGIGDGLAHRLSVDQYHALIRGGVLRADDPVELMEGYLVEKMSKNPPHRLATKLLRRLLEKYLPTDWDVDSQEPITLSDSEPEPDIAVIKGQPRDYGARHPGPAEVGLVVEVADSTLATDRGPKKRVYAQAGIPVYWIVNLPETKVEVYTQSAGVGDEADYQSCQEFGLGDAIPLILEGKQVGSVPVRDILP